MIKQGRLLGLKKWADSKRETANSASSKRKADAAADNEGCPMDKGVLGAATWGLVSFTPVCVRVCVCMRVCVCRIRVLPVNLPTTLERGRRSGVTVSRLHC